MIARLMALIVVLALAGTAQAERLTVFAAASLGDALREAADLWQDETGDVVTLVPAGSSALARQIAAGAPADLYISAHPGWMDWLQERELIRADTRRDLIGNSLVLVGHGGARIAPRAITAKTDIAALLPHEARLAMALVDAVPAGLYGKAALVWLGQWESLAPHVAQADNVRAALALVALGETPLGIVYATDAAAEPRVHVLGTFPPQSHPPIRYPAAVTAETPVPDAAAAFLDWLAGPEAGRIWADHGFVAPPG
ncbi:molybdate ABC transporter substrate-binding protein [Thalassococcus sp. BH17M4-6]|uniref:molybdate ABC transporter substrate-binding protein n=1 Tax=Thalassococcus sp. BH17M4-6 TaxID=3413148 RepID=UPI003BE3AB6B